MQFDYLIITLLTIIIIIQLLSMKKVDLKRSKKDLVILDSCALIDGRILELAKIGFLPEYIIIPSFILQELQLLADGRDSIKRERARFGLQVAKTLQQVDSLNVVIDQSQPTMPTIDEKLVSLAKMLKAKLFTTDYNLNQVASIEGVVVLNINELAHAIRPEILPGEQVTIAITQQGTNKNQGVGYLQDGTMVVVDDARREMGKAITVAITKSHQTVAGKMLFAKMIESQTKNKTTNKGNALNHQSVKK